ncbi:hypothetical protein HBB16_18345 [Pseudonocardia sp. MCCB 268]|nr:hypothetical protein [Pseudonocardia cytotoxica]
MAAPDRRRSAVDSVVVVCCQMQLTGTTAGPARRRPASRACATAPRGDVGRGGLQRTSPAASGPGRCRWRGRTVPSRIVLRRVDGAGEAVVRHGGGRCGPRPTPRQWRRRPASSPSNGCGAGRSSGGQAGGAVPAPNSPSAPYRAPGPRRAGQVGRRARELSDERGDGCYHDIRTADADPILRRAAAGHRARTGTDRACSTGPACAAS